MENRADQLSTKITSYNRAILFLEWEEGCSIFRYDKLALTIILTKLTITYVIEILENFRK